MNTFDVAVRAAQEAADSWSRAAHEAGLTITLTQYRVLTAIEDAAKTDAPKPSQTDIVVRTNVDRSTLADVIRRLVAQGLITRRRNSVDARAYALRLSPAGLEAIEQCHAVHQAAAARLKSRVVGLDAISFVEAA